MIENYHITPLSAYHLNQEPCHPISEMKGRHRDVPILSRGICVVWRRQINGPHTMQLRPAACCCYWPSKDRQTETDGQTDKYPTVCSRNVPSSAPAQRLNICHRMMHLSIFAMFFVRSYYRNNHNIENRLTRSKILSARLVDTVFHEIACNSSTIFRAEEEVKLCKFNG